MPMSNIKVLKANMLENDYLIDMFLFSFQKQQYSVYIKLLTPTDKEDSKNLKYYSVKLIFKKVDNMDDSFVTYANSRRFSRDIKDIREYFNINYHTNYTLLLKDFYSEFGQAIPTVASVRHTHQEKQDLAKALYVESEEADRLYCKRVRHNPIGEKRSEENSAKTKLLRPSLYDIFGDDPRISFVYFDDPALEKSDNQIELDFAKRNKK